MNNAVDWYVCPDGITYLLSRDDRGRVCFSWTDFLLVIRQEWANVYDYLERDSEKFQAALNTSYPGIRKLACPGEMPVFYSEGGVFIGSGVVDAERRVWVVGDRMIRENAWEDARKKGRIIRADQVPAGTTLVGNARRLARVIFGELSTTGDGSTFVGHGKNALDYHVKRLNERMKDHSKRRIDLLKVRNDPSLVSEACIAGYIEEAQLQDLESHVWLARYFLDGFSLTIRFIRTIWTQFDEASVTGKYFSILNAGLYRRLDSACNSS